MVRVPDPTSICCQKRCVTVGLCLSGGYSAQEKYSIFMRHRYSSCVEMLLELLEHQRHQIKVS